MNLKKEFANKLRIDEIERWVLRTAFLSQFLVNIKKMSRFLSPDILMFFYDIFLNINVIPPHEQGKHLDKIRELSDPDRKFKRFHTRGRN
jgi:hypothetical protein